MDQRRLAPARWVPSVIGRESRRDRRRVDPATWFPARSRTGIQAFSRESPDAKSRGGGPPPPFFMARSFPLAGFGGCAALFRWWGYFVPHLRALIWNAFSCRIARPRGFPSGGSCHRRGRMRGRPGCPTGQEKKPVGATGSNPLFYKERLGTKSPPHPTRLRRPTFPPRGRLLGVSAQQGG